MLLRAAVLTSWSPTPNRRRSPSTWTSQRWPAVVASDADLLPRTTQTIPLEQTRRLTQPAPLRSARLIVEFDGADAGAPAVNRCAGVAIFND